jgi:erythromycin esterase-like protein
MSEPVSPVVSTSKPGKKRPPPFKPAGIRHLGKNASAEARRLAAAILECLAGMRTPRSAAEALKLSLPRYYQLEARALDGMLAACEPRPLGRVKTSASALATLQRECGQWRQECARQQALVRAMQRAIGLAAPPAKTDSSKRRKRRPMVRALKAVEGLRNGESAEVATDSARSVP